VNSAGKVIPFLSDLQKARFWAQVNFDSSDKCWEWGAVSEDRYGKIRLNGDHYQTHRVVYAIGQPAWTPQGRTP
jgi:hypothetical protein